MFLPTALRPLLYAGAIALLAPAAAAQTALLSTAALLSEPDTVAVAPAPSGQFRAVRTAEAPEVDGRLDDVAWTRAVPIEGFRQSQPEEGARATQRTVVHVLYDDD